jgi:uncharacterized protein (DUF488 family)
VTTIYSVGHSNHAAEEFVALLREHGVELVVDVRSSPYSRYVPQANRQALATTLEAAGIAYRWAGDRLGGKPGGEVADYDELRDSVAFREGVAELVALAAERTTAMMCAEGDHRRCHRHKLITPALLDRNVRVLHIQPDGTLVDEAQEPKQLSLF